MVMIYVMGAVRYIVSVHKCFGFYYEHKNTVSVIALSQYSKQQDGIYYTGNIF